MRIRKKCDGYELTNTDEAIFVGPLSVTSLVLSCVRMSISSLALVICYTHTVAQSLNYAGNICNIFIIHNFNVCYCNSKIKIVVINMQYLMNTSIRVATLKTLFIRGNILLV